MAAKKKKGKKKGSGGLLTDEQRRDLLGLALILLAAFTALSLIPPAAVGLGATPNLMGAVGTAFRDAGYFGLGVGVYVVPLIPTLGAIASFGFHTETALRWGILTVIVTLLLPVAVAIPGATAAAGWWGSMVADPLVSGLGAVGAGLLLGFVAIAASIVTIGWNPARSAAGGATKGARALKGAVDAIDPDAVSGPVRRLFASLKPRRKPKAALDEGVHLAEEPPEAGEAPADGRGGEPAVADAQAPEASGSAGEPETEPEPAGAGPVGSGPSGPAPPVDALQAKPERDPALTEQELDRLADVLVDTLETFKVQGEIVGRTTGPVVTQYEFAPAPGIKVSRVEALDADLALALKAPSVRIVAPIPGKAAVGVEVPNPEPEMVYLREIVEAPVFARHAGQLPLALGKDLEGTPYVSDLARMPHLLIAGATGSGKSVCINTVITSLIYKHSPETLRLLLIDPKMVELSMYRDLPHLRHPVVTDPEEAGLVLRWMVYEMERRYELLSQNSVRSIAEFNKRVEEGVTLRRAEPEGEEGDPDRWVWDDGPLPYVVLIVDELADLMMQAQADVERPLAQLAQKARAIGIHLIVATQRPSVNVITGLIKANFPSRIGFRVSSKVDSRTILDQNGADALLGNGDMLFLPPGTSDPVRIQGAFVSTEETERLMKWYRDRAEADDEERDILEVVREKDQAAAGDVAEEVLEDWDELFRQAAEVCIQNEQGSTSLLQRRLRVGYGRAARIVDQLEHAGVLGPPDGTKPREVLVGMDGLDLIIAGQSEGPEDLRDDDGPEPEPSLEELEGSEDD